MFLEEFGKLDRSRAERKRRGPVRLSVQGLTPFDTQ